MNLSRGGHLTCIILPPYPLFVPPCFLHKQGYTSKNTTHLTNPIILFILHSPTSRSAREHARHRPIHHLRHALFVEIGHALKPLNEVSEVAVDLVAVPLGCPIASKARGIAVACKFLEPFALLALLLVWAGCAVCCFELDISYHRGV